MLAVARAVEASVVVAGGAGWNVGRFARRDALAHDVAANAAGSAYEFVLCILHSEEGALSEFRLGVHAV